MSLLLTLSSKLKNLKALSSLPSCIEENSQCCLPGCSRDPTPATLCGASREVGISRRSQLIAADLWKLMDYVTQAMERCEGLLGGQREEEGSRVPASLILQSGGRDGDSGGVGLCLILLRWRPEAP